VDIQGAAFGTDDRQFLLRAERSGTGSGRVYTITYEAADDSGNVTTRQATVTVPRNQGN
jgi:endo-1,4-beta-xylanase